MGTSHVRSQMIENSYKYLVFTVLAELVFTWNELTKLSKDAIIPVVGRCTNFVAKTCEYDKFVQKIHFEVEVGSNDRQKIMELSNKVWMSKLFSRDRCPNSNLFNLNYETIATQKKSY